MEQEQTLARRARRRRTLLTALLVLLVMPGTILFGVYCLDDRKYYFISLLLILYTMVPFLLVFERRRPQARELMILAVMSALAVASRVAFFMLPQFKPITAIVILTGIALGPQAGFLTGAVSGFLSNFFFGQGPWTPWQMFSFGILGFLFGLLFYGRRRPTTARDQRLWLVLVSLLGFVGVMAVYGPLMNLSAVMMITPQVTWSMFWASVVVAIPMDLVHAGSTALFLLLLTRPILEKLERVQIKYGLLETPPTSR